MVWFEDLELGLSFPGQWSVHVRQPPPFPVVCGEWLDAPVSMEAYCLEADLFPTAEAVALDLTGARLKSCRNLRCTPGTRGWHVTASGREVDLPTDIWAYLTYQNEVWYVLAFSGWRGGLEPCMDEIIAMATSATSGEGKARQRGVLSWVRNQLSSAGVQAGRSRAEVGFTRAQSTVRRGRPQRWVHNASGDSEDVAQDEWVQDGVILGTFDAPCPVRRRCLGAVNQTRAPARWLRLHPAGVP